MRLFKTYGKVYLWTFTFVNTPASDWAANDAWNALHNRLKDAFPQLRGIRVTELHRSHGIHYHCLVNMRIPIEHMRRLINGCGHWGDACPRSSYSRGKGKGNTHCKGRRLDFGRIDVRRCNEDMISYLCFYFTHKYKKEYQLYEGRRWGSMGGFDVTHVRDIVFESDCTRNRDWLFMGGKCSYTSLIMVQHYSNLYGDCRDWPQAARSTVYRNSHYVWRGKMHRKRINLIRAKRHVNVRKLPERDATFDIEGRRGRVVRVGRTYIVWRHESTEIGYNNWKVELFGKEYFVPINLRKGNTGVTSDYRPF